MIVIGNGESRAGITLPHGKQIIGCNALHRDMEVQHLVCVDRRCVKEALVSANCINTRIYTRSEWKHEFNDSRVCQVPELPYSGALRQDMPFHWGSGGFAILIAALLSNNIEIVGFDLWGNGNQVNNVYKGTTNYSKSDSHSVDPSYWIYQISKIFQCFPDKYFTVYNLADWKMPETWRLANVEFKTIDMFQQ